ncbi:hypothetical protein VCRA2113O415_160052 [Vibrio crassostreae]|nr:hypothetical protein VCRA2110O182_80075 [Vibrio crassostreae]CAK2366255.1 hypothetical protein VCRA2111O408_80075 [Vibrio crassostreae]CAK2380193.1 hypothetical protein VCRA211O406_80120 [Vibrio crassostreae]CAK2416981.1 hypothetical protein VCRA2113O415_160052 [Vibrio crassostreae]CAK2528114.1 hypothetical protein VCRA2113O420_100090 [Vibrio crassostreae]
MWLTSLASQTQAHSAEHSKIGLGTLLPNLGPRITVSSKAKYFSELRALILCTFGGI